MRIQHLRNFLIILKSFYKKSKKFLIVLAVMKIILNNLEILIKSFFNENTVKNLCSIKFLGVFNKKIFVYISKENKKKLWQNMIGIRFQSTMSLKKNIII